MRPNQMGASDIIIWTPLASGIYSTKSGYFETANAEAITMPNFKRNTEFNWIKNVWTITTALKIQIFIWKVLQEALSLGPTLQRCGLLAEAVTCSRCGEAETAIHIFLNCRFTKRIWKILPLNRPTDPTTFDSFEQAIAKQARNSLIFEKLDLSQEDIVCKSLHLAREWKEAQLPKEVQHSLQPRPSPTLDQEAVTCHTDASWTPKNGEAGFGWIFLDSTG
ncbi:uncharacterized protein LOC130495963 [Raphanus sativus]|uniref:Uncharacterized protein LOC130495963 n=1 Tax=Raphanus sativus TaxID=3726 RepID=A0A9W3BWF4_RAPSA|nr:uncharacterized protein LOC130495963 [Raphanus sativus]